MKREFSITLLVAVIVTVLAALSFSRAKENSLTLASETTIPTSGILGTSQTPPAKDSYSPVVSQTPPLTTREANNETTTAVQLATCSSAKSNMVVSATEFMKNHQSKKAYDVLTMIYQPQPDDPEFNFWLGSGDENAGGLYQTAATSYTTKNFTLGTVADTGEHNEIRGSKRCQMTVIEEREKINADQTVLTESYTRFIEFAVSVDGEIELTAFRDSASGSKYSGFN